MVMPFGKVLWARHLLLEFGNDLVRCLRLLLNLVDALIFWINPASSKSRFKSIEIASRRNNVR